MENIANKAFLTYFDNEVMYEMLDDQEAGRLIKAMFRFCKDGEETLTKEDGMVYGYFIVLQSQYMRDYEKYVKKVEKKKEADAERYKKRKEAEVKTGDEVNSPLPFDDDEINSDKPF